MKSNSISFVITIIVALILSQFLPWWSVMVAGFVTALFFEMKPAYVFFVPFLAIFIFWSIYAFWLGSANDFVMSKRIATLLPLQGNALLLILVTGIVGGIAAGVAALFGKQCRMLVKK